MNLLSGRGGEEKNS